MTIKLIIAYDGTTYDGWQRNHKKDTVQGRIENVLSKHFEEPIEIVGSGRTDAGVHAWGQVASFAVDRDIDPAALRDHMNLYLPEAIRIRRAEIVGDRFHARYAAAGKVYRYQIDLGDVYDPLRRHVAIHHPGSLDLAAMQSAADHLVGTHDFSSFTQMKSKKKSRVRRLDAIDIEREGTLLTLRFTGEGFLYKMVRILVGTLLEVGTGVRRPQDMAVVLAKKDRNFAGETAPAKGLTLERVIY